MASCEYVQVFTLVGNDGATVRDATKRILHKLFSTKVAMELNYMGRGDKTGNANVHVTDANIGKSAL